MQLHVYVSNYIISYFLMLVTEKDRLKQLFMFSLRFHNLFTFTHYGSWTYTPVHYKHMLLVMFQTSKHKMKI